MPPEVMLNMHTIFLSWWRHQMKHFPRYLPFVGGIHRSLMDSPHTGQIVSLVNKRLSKQSKCWWFETQWRSLWRHRDVIYSPSWDVPALENSNIGQRLLQLTIVHHVRCQLRMFCWGALGVDVYCSNCVKCTLYIDPKLLFVVYTFWYMTIHLP